MKWQDVFGHTILELAQSNEKIVGITPAMPTGSSLKYMMEAMPNRALDVGIAEQHAVTLAAGMATQGLVPFCTIYSTFLQRAYDQLIHDVALQNLPVIFCIDRAGLVGADGATHHGAYDISYLRCVPNLILAAPRTAQDLRDLMYMAALGLDAPIAIRYPRGASDVAQLPQDFNTVQLGKAKELRASEGTAVITTGPIARIAEALYDSHDFGHFDFTFIKPLDGDMLIHIAENYDQIITIEDGTIIGGLGSAILGFYALEGIEIFLHPMGIPDRFIEQGTTQELRNEINLTSEQLAGLLEELG